jgi:hypothetical protein
MLSFISVLLTNFRLGPWLNRVFAKRTTPEAGKDEDAALERRARDLEKRKKQLEEEVARSGLGPDLKPVPEPTVRDLSVPQPKTGKGRKQTANEPEPPDEGEIISAREIAAATTGDILGKKSDPAEVSPSRASETKNVDSVGVESPKEAANPTTPATPVAKPKLTP